MVSSRSQMKTLSVVDSGVVGDTVLVRRPRPRVPLCSVPKVEVSRDLRALSALRGEVEPSTKLMPFEGLSEIFKSNLFKWSSGKGTIRVFGITCVAIGT